MLLPAGSFESDWRQLKYALYVTWEIEIEKHAEPVQTPYRTRLQADRLVFLLYSIIGIIVVYSLLGIIMVYSLLGIIVVYQRHCIYSLQRKLRLYYL